MIGDARNKIIQRPFKLPIKDAGLRIIPTTITAPNKAEYRISQRMVVNVIARDLPAFVGAKSIETPASVLIV